MYLLTETASDFFAAKFGFRVVDRSTLSRAVAFSETFMQIGDPERGKSGQLIAMRLARFGERAPLVGVDEDHLPRHSQVADHGEGAFLHRLLRRFVPGDRAHAGDGAGLLARCDVERTLATVRGLEGADQAASARGHG